VSGLTRSGLDTPCRAAAWRGPHPSGHHPSACRQTRIAQLVTDLDVKLTATALAMNDTGLVRYLAENVDRDRLTATKRTARADPGAPGATLHTLP
jgi:hypothetical protein